MLTCNILEEADGSAWQEFVCSRPQCGLYHDLGWKDVIEASYGHRVPYLLTKRNNKITGILPLALVRSRFFGNSLTSLPFLDFCGLAADDEQSQLSLLKKAEELGQKFGVDYIELRQREPTSGNFRTSTQKVLMTLELGSNEDELWNRLSSERRNRVRRAIKSGLSVEISESSMLPVFYDIWTRNMRDLGSPPHSQKFFERVLENFEGRCAILLVRLEKRYVGSALALFSKDTFTLPWVSSLREYFRLYPNNLLYWDAMRFAIQRGVCVFDFGRSTQGSGTYEFKSRWGAVATPLYWQFLQIKGRQVKTVSDASKFQLAVKVWRRLPISVTRMIGPAVRKYITA